MQARRVLALRFLEDHPGDAAAVLERRPVEDVVALLGECRPVVAAAVLHRMDRAAGAAALEACPPASAARIAAALPVAALAALLRRLAPNVRERLLAALPRQASAPARLLLSFPEGAAGAMMDPHVRALPGDISARAALVRLREATAAPLDYVYVVDREQRLIGVLTARELLTAHPQAQLATIMHAPVTSLAARSDTLEIVSHPAWQRHHALPVVNPRGVYLGAIRYETLRALETSLRAGRTLGAPLGAALSLAEAFWRGLAELMTDLSVPAGGDTRA